LLRTRHGPGWRAHDVSPIGFLLIFGTPRVMAGRGWLTPRPGSSLLVQLLQHLAEFAVESNVDGLKARPRRLGQAEPAATILHDVVPTFYGTCRERPSLAVELN